MRSIPFSVQFGIHTPFRINIKNSKSIPLLCITPMLHVQFQLPHTLYQSGRAQPKIYTKASNNMMLIHVQGCIWATVSDIHCSLMPKGVSQRIFLINNSICIPCNFTAFQIVHIYPIVSQLLEDDVFGWITPQNQ